jgi:uncharacterized protein YacL
MFRQVKSALFWYYLYKFRRRVILIAFLLLFAIFASSIYGDIIQYLTLKKKLEYLEIALLIKWIIIIFNILFSLYLILTVFKDKEKLENKDIKNTTNIKTKEAKKKEKNPSSKFSKREEEFLKKDLSQSKADFLVKR